MSTPTPEERAADTWGEIATQREDGPAFAREIIADTIRAAVAAEREACARVAEGGDWEPVAGKDYYETVDVPGTAGAIAYAIRARGKT